MGLSVKVIKEAISKIGYEQAIIDSVREAAPSVVSIVISNPYNLETAYTFKNWRTEYGPFNLKRAIANSCNIYFFTVGGGHEKIKGLGIEKIVKYLTRFLTVNIHHTPKLSL